MSAPRTRLLRHSLLLFAAFLFVGCGPAEPLDQVVTARSFADYDRWIYRHRSSLDERSARELSAALDQLKLRVQLERTGQSPKTIAKRALDQIDGLTAREIITQSLIWRHRFLAEENRKDDDLAEKNATFPITPDADPSIVRRFQNQLETIRRRQTERTREMEEIVMRLSELNPGVDHSRLLQTPGKTAPAPRVRPL